jgi:hypothetical protein
MAVMLLKLRTALDHAGHKEKLIGYTTRFNTFFDDDSRPDGCNKFPSDGEGIMIDNALKSLNSTIKDAVSFTNIMLYDIAPTAVGAPADGLTLKQYQAVYQSFENHFDKD